MPKKLFFVVTAALLCLLVNIRDTLAQSDTPKFEVGAQFSTIRLGDFDPGNELIRQRFPNIVPPRRIDRAEPGLGGRFTFNLTGMVALEAEANFFPRDENPATGFSGGRKTEYLFGPKIGLRSKRIGVFGKVRPGFVRFERFPTIFLVSQGPSSVNIGETDGEAANFFALDLGGVAELYASHRIVVRFDLGDTIIHYRKRSDPNDLAPAYTRHNLQFNAGVGFRF